MPIQASFLVVGFAGGNVGKPCPLHEETAID
jgi:hypothetical protein